VTGWRELGRWPSRIAALGVLALLLGLLHAGLVAPYLDYLTALDERVAIKAALLDRMRAVAEAPPPPAAPEGALARLLLPDLSDAQAVGQVQDRLKHLAANSGVELQGIQVLPRSDMPGLVRLAVRLRASADMAALQRFLHDIESAEPALLVDNLRIQSRLARGPASVGAAPGAAAPLDIQLDAIGFKVDAS
jgi:Type II secretion system (T2SS), protein M subtype b